MEESKRLKQQTAFKKHYEKNKQVILKNAIEWNRNNPEKRLLAFARNRAKLKNIPFDLSIDDIKIPDVCPVLGIPLKKGGPGKRVDNSATLDRVIPNVGYVKGNVIVISFKANKIKSDATVVELQKVTEFYTRLLCILPT